VYAADPASLVRVATLQGVITHRDPRCSAGAIVVAGATALALEPGPIDEVAFCARLAAWAAPSDRRMAEALGQLPGWLSGSPAVALAAIRATNLTGDDDWDGISPFVTESVLWSVYAFLRSPQDYWTAVMTAIAVGGDVDTTGAMTGAMAGARVGLAGLPPELSRTVTDQGTWEYPALVDLGRRLARIRSAAAAAGA